MRYAAESKLLWRIARAVQYAAKILTLSERTRS